MSYARSPFRDFERYLRIVVVLDEDYIQLFLKQNNSSFVTSEISPGKYLIKVISDVVYTMGDHEGTLQIGYDNISLKTKLISTRFSGTFGTLRFDQRSFWKVFWVLHRFRTIILQMHFMLIVRVYTLVGKC